MSNYFTKKKSGYTLIETLFYVSLFAVLFIAIINALLVTTSFFRDTSVIREMVSATSMMERISREIRQAEDIDIMSATSLKLDTTDSEGDPKTVRFTLSGSDLQLWEDEVLSGNLNTPNISVSGLSFTSITTVKSKAIKVSFDFESDNDPAGTGETLYTTVVLRGSY